MSSRSNGEGRSLRAGMADAELMVSLRSAGGDALAALIGRYERLVHRVAAHILRDAGEADDVTQEVFLEVYSKAHLYDPARGSVRGWLLQYAYHRSLRRKDALRRRAAYRSEPIENVEVASGDQRRGLTSQERRWLLRAGLAHLPERQRATLEMTCFEELTLRDVAERLRVSLGCARHYYYRGLAGLRAWVQLTTVPAPGARGGVAGRAVGPSRHAARRAGAAHTAAGGAATTRAARGATGTARGASSAPAAPAPHDPLGRACHREEREPERQTGVEVGGVGNRLHANGRGLDGVPLIEREGGALERVVPGGTRRRQTEVRVRGGFNRRE